MSSLSEAGNNGSEPDICAAPLDDAQQVSSMEEGNDAPGVGANANMDATKNATVNSVYTSSPPLMPPMSDSQTIAAVTEIAAQHDQMEKELKGITSNVSLLEPPLPDAMIAAPVHQTFDKVEGDDLKMNLAGLHITSDEVNSTLLPPISDAETTAAVLDVDAQCHQTDEEIKRIAKRASPIEPPLPDNAIAAAVDQSIDRGMGTDSSGLDMASDNSGQVNLEGGDDIGDEGSEIAHATVGQTTPRDQSLGQGPMKGSAATLTPGPPTPQAAGRVEDISDDAESLTAPGVLELDPSIPILEAMLVEDEIPTARVDRFSVYQATQIPDPLPVPWWKRHQKCLMGVSAAILVALSVALGVVLSRGEPPTAPPPSDSNFTAPKSNTTDSTLKYYADGPNRLCMKDEGEQPNDESGANFYLTIADCCKNEFWHLQDDECMMNSFGMTHVPSSVPSGSPSTSDIPSSPPSSSLGPSIRPTSSWGPSSSPVPTSEPSSIPSTRPSTQIESSALRLVTSEAVAGGHYSTENVAVRGDIAVVGAPLNENEKGAAFVLKRDETGWSEVTKLEAPGGEEEDRFGRSVAIDGDTIIVGAWGGDNGGKESVHVFVKIDDSWQHQARLVQAPDRKADDDDVDLFGWSVGIHRDRVVVGAQWDDCNGYNAGSAYVFVRNDTTWALEDELLAPDGDALDGFGVSVGIYDNTIVVGAPGEDAGATASGAAHVYSRTSGGSWEHRARLSNPDGASGDFFGASVGIHRNRVIVGAPWDDSNGGDAGASFIFSDEGSEWRLDAKLLAPDGTAGGFGTSVAIFDGTAVVGSPWDDDNGSDSGSVHRFELTRGAWSHRAKLLSPDGLADDGFGYSAAVHNGTVIAHSMGSGETFVFSG